MDVKIDDIASSFTTLFTNTFGRTLRFRSEGGSTQEGVRFPFPTELVDQSPKFSLSVHGQAYRESSWRFKISRLTLEWYYRISSPRLWPSYGVDRVVVICWYWAVGFVSLGLLYQCMKRWPWTSEAANVDECLVCVCDLSLGDCITDACAMRREGICRSILQLQPQCTVESFGFLEQLQSQSRGKIYCRWRWEFEVPNMTAAGSYLRNSCVSPPFLPCGRCLVKWFSVLQICFANSTITWSTDLNPIGGISKTGLRILKWAQKEYKLEVLEDFLDATPTAELEPRTYVSFNSSLAVAYPCDLRLLI